MVGFCIQQHRSATHLRFPEQTWLCPFNCQNRRRCPPKARSNSTTGPASLCFLKIDSSSPGPMNQKLLILFGFSATAMETASDRTPRVLFCFFPGPPLDPKPLTTGRSPALKRASPMASKPHEVGSQHQDARELRHLGLCGPRGAAKDEAHAGRRREDGWLLLIFLLAGLLVGFSLFECCSLLLLFDCLSLCCCLLFVFLFRTGDLTSGKPTAWF